MHMIECRCALNTSKSLSSNLFQRSCPILQTLLFLQVSQEKIFFFMFPPHLTGKDHVLGKKSDGFISRMLFKPATWHDGPSGPERIKAPSVNTKSNWPFATRRTTCMRKRSTAAQQKRCVRTGFGSRVCPKSQSSWCIVSASLAAGDVCI